MVFKSHYYESIVPNTGTSYKNMILRIFDIKHMYRTESYVIKNRKSVFNEWLIFIRVGFLLFCKLL